MSGPGDFVYSAIIILLSLICIASNLYLVNTYLANKKYLSIFQAFNFYYLGLIYIGAVAINVYKFSYEDYFGFYRRPDLVFNIWLLSSAALILMPFGALLYNVATQFSPRRSLQSFSAGEAIYQNKTNYSYVTTIFYTSLLLICIFVFILYKSAVGDLAVLHILEKLSPSEFSTLRSDATNDFSGKFSRYQVFLSTIPNFLLIISYLLKKDNVFWKILFVISLSISLFFALINVEKAPIINVLLFLFFAHLFVSPKLNVKKILTFLTFALVGMFLLYTTIMGMGEKFIGEIFGAIFHRIFIGQVHPLFWWQMYLQENGTLGFAGMPNPGGILPFTPVSMTVLIHQYAFPEIVKEGIVGSMPTVYFAYPMLSFGYIAALISMMVFGCLMQFVDHLFSRYMTRRPNIFIISLYLLMVNFFLRYISDGFEGILFDYNWMIPLMICIFFTLLINDLRGTRSVKT